MVSKRLSYANVVASLALFLTLGGVGYAATQLPSNSVGTSQLKANAVTSSKVKNGSLLKADFKSGQLPAGAKGATGPAGPAGAAGAKGDPGANFTLATTLPSGQTERGDYSVWGGGVGGFVGDAINYRIPLAQGIAAGNAHFVTGSAFTAQCPGFGQAAAGNACVYEETNSNTTFLAIDSQFNGTQTHLATSVIGFQLVFNTTAATAFSYGEWAVTAA